MERLVLMRPWEAVDAADLAFIRERRPVPEPWGMAISPGAGELELPEEGLDIEELNRKIIRQALEKHQGNRTRTAQYLGISRRVLEGRLKKL